MANKKIRLGILAMVLVFGLMVVGCDGGGNGSGGGGMYDGTYVNQSHTTYKIIIAGHTFTSSKEGTDVGKGTYTLSGNAISGHSTQAWNGSTWYAFTGHTISGTYDGSNSFVITITGEGVDTYFNGTYVKQ